MNFKVNLLLTVSRVIVQVFEVNASSQRSGRLILSQLKEATQSHQVGSSTGVSVPSKPAYFTSHTAAAGCSSKPVVSSRKFIMTSTGEPDLNRNVMYR